MHPFIREMGLEWVIFRIGYSLRKRLGMIKRSSPTYSWNETPLSSLVKDGIPTDPAGFAEWRMKNSPVWIFEDLPTLTDEVPWNPDQAVIDADRILSGEWKYFSNEWIKTGFPPDWHVDPKSGIQLDPKKHWSTINEYGNYDIKYVWEASRLSMVFTLVRAYARKQDNRYAEAFWQLGGRLDGKNCTRFRRELDRRVRKRRSDCWQCALDIMVSDRLMPALLQGQQAYHSGRGAGKKDRTKP